MRGKRLHRLADFRDLQRKWVEQRPAPNWQLIEDALRHTLTVAERERIQKMINLQYTIFKSNRETKAARDTIIPAKTLQPCEVRNQDVIETLRELAKLSRHQVTGAYARSGHSVRVQVQSAMHRAGVRDSYAITNPTPDQIRTFAGIASRDVRRPSGRPQAARMFDEIIVALWKELGGTLTDGSGRLSSSLILFARELHKRSRAETRQEGENLPALRARLRAIARR